jgi:hypothetical protein
VRLGPGGRVAETDGGGERGGVDGGDVGPASPAGEEGGESPGQPPCLGVVSGAYGVLDGRREDGVLAGEPGHGLVVRGEFLGSGAVRRRGRRERVAVGQQETVGGVCRVRVVVEYAGECQGRFGRGRLLPGQFEGVRAQQVVAGEAAGHGFLHEVVGLETTQPGAEPGGRQGGEARGGRQADVGAGCLGEPTEDPGGVGVQGQVGGGEDGAYVTARLAGLQGVEPGGRVAQFGGQGGEGEDRAGGDAGGEDADGQREPGAVVEEFRRRFGFGGEPVGADAADQQLACLGAVERVQGEPADAVGGGESGQLVSTGDEDRAGGAARQQGQHLVAVAGVVEHDQ